MDILSVKEIFNFPKKLLYTILSFIKMQMRKVFLKNFAVGDIIGR